MSGFAHLHVHSQYSLLEGAIRVKELCKRTVELGQKAVAVTDHNNLHGAIDFYKQAKEHGIKAIIGCELGFEQSRHLVLLARDMVGYKNLIGLVSEAWLEAPEGSPPRSSIERLAKRSKGLVVLSGCLAGVVPQAILMHSPKRGAETLAKLRDACEPGSLLVELQDHGFVEQPLVNKILIDQAKDLGLSCVATNDAHFLRREDSIAFRLLGCIASGETMDSAAVHTHSSTEMYLKSGEEMQRLHGNFASTDAVLEMIGKVDPTSKPMLPKFSDGDTVEQFKQLARDGLRDRELSDRKSYHDRLESEIAMIVSMGFADYFLIVWDMIHWAKTNDVPVGPGRGSGAGSLVAYALRITDLDPIEHKLIFERFLNPDRVSMPDFDIDFCMLKRERVIEYVKQRYGAASVGQIATFQMLRSKSVVRDVGRAMGMPLSDVNTIAKLIPDPVQGKSVTIAEAIEKEPQLKLLYDEDKSPRELLDLAQKLENLNRHAGMHAAGIVISQGPLWETVPVFKGRGGEVVTQFAKDEVEYAGLVKFDLLGLTTLTVIDIAVELINKRKLFSLDEITLEDPKTYELLQTGKTTGVFQLESPGMQKLFRDMHPTRFDDIVAAVALYRPGPLGAKMLDAFVDCKSGKASPEYPHPTLEPILKDTYGVITYQEQVMMIARTMAGYSLGESDLLRRAMGKKKPEEMAKQKSIFIEGAKKKGYTEELAIKTFDKLEYFAAYGFNRSHSAAYAMLTLQTAYLKTHYPVEFICATLTSDLGKIDKIIGTINEGRAMGIEVLPPDVNESDRQFTVVDGRIRFGLGAIKGGGDVSVDAILSARGTQPFRDIFDFSARVSVGSNVLEALVSSGAFDATLAKTGNTRSQAFAAISGLAKPKKKDANQLDLFSAKEMSHTTCNYPSVGNWDTTETLRREHAAIGLYLSGHPLDRYAQEAQAASNATTARIAELGSRTEVGLAGVVEDFEEKTTKAGSRMAFFQLSDHHGRASVVIWPKTFEAKKRPKNGDMIFLRGKVWVDQRKKEEGEEDVVEEQETEHKIEFVEFHPLGEYLQNRTKFVYLNFRAEHASEKRWTALRSVLETFKGVCEVRVTISLPGGDQIFLELPPSLRVEPSEAMLAQVERIFGEKVVELRT